MTQVSHYANGHFVIVTLCILSLHTFHDMMLTSEFWTLCFSKQSCLFLRSVFKFKAVNWARLLHKSEIHQQATLFQAS